MSDHSLEAVLGTPTSSSAPTCARTPSSIRTGWFVATPTRVSVPGATIDVHDVLVLTHFAKQPLVDFGRVPMGRLATQRLLIQNPHAYDQEVRISRLPGEKCGIACVEQEFVVNAEGEYMLTLTWTPQRPGGMRELAAFRVGDVYNLQAVLLGMAVEVPAASHGRKRKTWVEQRLAGKENDGDDNAAAVPSPVFNVAKARLASGPGGLSRRLQTSLMLPATPEEAPLVTSTSSVSVSDATVAASKKPRLAEVSFSGSGGNAASSLLSHLLHSRLAARLRPKHHPESPVERFRRRHSLRSTLTGRFASSAAAAARTSAAAAAASPSEQAISSPLSGRIVKRRKSNRVRVNASTAAASVAGSAVKCIVESPSATLVDASDLSGLSMLAPTTPKASTAASMTAAEQRSCSTYYDERWREKQEFGLQQWLNYLLTPGLALRCCQGEEPAPPASTANSVADVTTVAAGATTGPAPTKEAMSLRAYADFRALAALRSRGRRLIGCESFVSVICRVEREVSEGRLRVRSDVCFRADRGLRARLTDLYLAFHPLWLRLALESLFGEPILAPAASSSADTGGAAGRRTPLRSFLQSRVLWSPGLADRFAMPGVCNLYRKGFDAELAKYVLNKFLAIVYFLDRAKTERVIDFDPCLFAKRSPHKCTKDVVTSFTRDYLAGEGDVIKHLGYLGYRLCHAQKPLDEFQFGVTNLAVDLRDGIRLCRTLEILTGGRAALSGRLRCPAISRLQKIRNCQVAFEELRGLGVSLDWTSGNPIDPRDIVDGHREKTLSLLWRCLARFALAEDPKLVGRLLFEIRALRRALHDRGAACPPAPTDPKPASLLPCWAACVAAFDWPAGLPPPAEDDSRVVMRLLRHYCAAPPASSAEEDQDWRTVSERLAELGQCPALILPTSSDRPDRSMLLAQLAALAGCLLNLNTESRAARVIQAAWRRRRAQRTGPPAAQEDRVDALPAENASCFVATVTDFGIGFWPGTPGPSCKPADTPVRCLRDEEAARRSAAASSIQRWYRYGRQIRLGRIRREIERRRRRRAILVILTNYRISRRNRAFAALQSHVTSWLARRLAAALCIQEVWRAHRLRRMERERLARVHAACTVQRAWRLFFTRRREQERLERQRLEQERLEQERLECERLEHERLEKERLEQERLEQEWLERERIEQERLEQERLEQERFERERIEQERLEQERLEQERLEQERLEQERLEQERLEQEWLEQERLEQERLEQERLEQERIEQERLEQERLEQERLEQERLELERLERERLEQERLEQERLELERLERERLDQERLEQKRLEQERLEQERLEQERLEQERIDKERIEQERLEQQRLEQQRLKQERIEQERLEQQRLTQERIEQERLEQERIEQQRIERERLEQERLEQERLEQERLEQERLEQARLEQERFELERIEQERLEQERLEQEQLEQQKRDQVRLELQRQSESLAACRIQRAWRGLVARRLRRQQSEQEQRSRAATTLQAAFRGWRVRARCQVAAMPQLRRRISAAYADACRYPERRLLARARSALRFARQQPPAAVAQQLADLRAGTSHSAKLCELLCSQAGAVSALFALMAGCNRSLPHQYIVLHSVQVLHNLIRHSATAASVAKECPANAGDVLTDALVSGAVVRASPLQQELVKACAGLLASLVSSGFALSRRATVRLRETRDALLRRAGLEESRLVSQLKASGALLVRVEPDWVMKRSANQHMASPITAVTYLCELLHH